MDDLHAEAGRKAGRERPKRGEGDDAEEKNIDVPQAVVTGMYFLKYNEREVLFMTPRKLSIMLKAYQDFHSGGKRKNGSIDDLP